MPCPGSDNFTVTEKPVKRLPRATTETLTRGKGVVIHHYNSPNIPPMSLLKFDPLPDIQSPYISPPSVKLELVWKVSHVFRGESNPIANWSGFMQDLTTGEHLPPGDIRMLPIIDMDPGDRTCIFSTLLFIIDQAKKLNICTPCVTFDQPLWLKATEVAKSESLNIVIRMGVFHMIMSFLGSIGTVMSGAGLSDGIGNVLWPECGHSYDQRQGSCSGHSRSFVSRSIIICAPFPIFTQ